MYQRGVIINRERKQQIIDYSGILIGAKGTPTDIDGLIEYRNRAVILMEFKYGNAKMPYGQKLAFTRIMDDCQSAGKQAVLLVCQHDEADTQNDIDAARAIVRELYYQKQWYIDGRRTVKSVIDNFLKFVERGEKH